MMAREHAAPDDFYAKLRKLGQAAYAEQRKRGVSDAEIQKAIAKEKRKPRRSKNA